MPLITRILAMFRKASSFYSFAVGTISSLFLPQCGADYCGETTRHFKTRIAEHRGVSVRTNRPLTVINSVIHGHALQNNQAIDPKLFKILAISNSLDIRITESIFIHKIKPSLNRSESSTPLQILV